MKKAGRGYKPLKKAEAAVEAPTRAKAQERSGPVDGA
jgi:hypothetical protein